MTDIFGMTPRFYSGGWEGSCVNGGFGSMDRTRCNLRDRRGIEAAGFFFFFLFFFFFFQAASAAENSIHKQGYNWFWILGLRACRLLSETGRRVGHWYLLHGTNRMPCCLWLCKY